MANQIDLSLKLIKPFFHCQFLEAHPNSSFFLLKNIGHQKKIDNKLIIQICVMIFRSITLKILKIIIITDITIYGSYNNNTYKK